MAAPRDLLVAAGRDARWALRILARNPVSTAVAIGVLALGIGVNTAVFSLLKDAWLDRLPVTRPGELVQVILEAPGARMSNLPYPASARWLRSVRGFDGVLFYQDREVNLRDGGWSGRARARLVSGDFYSTLGVAAAAGRVLVPEDDWPSSAPVAVISHGFWTRRFARDPAALGRAVHVSGRPFTIVGITPRSFFGVDRLQVPEITIPLRSEAGQVQALARLKRGVPFEQARAEVSGRLRHLLGDAELSTANWPTRGSPVGATLESATAGTWGIRLRLLEPLRALSALAFLVLLMTCLSLASLVHARAAARSREFGVRLAVGADRGRLVRQILVEGVILGAVGGLAGLVVSLGVHRLVVGLLPVEPGAALAFRLDVWALTFNTTASVVAGIGFGVGPALRASSLAPSAVLGGGTGGPTARGGRARFRAALAAQVAASLVLSVAAVMFGRTLVNLLDVEAGFDRAHTLLVTIDPEDCGLTPERMIALTDELAQRVRALPGVQAAGVGLLEVSSMRGWAKTMWVEGHESAPGEDQTVNFGVVGPGFLAAAGVPLLAGRDFAGDDGRGAPPVAIVNQAMAERYFPRQDPLGRRLGDGRGPGAGRRRYEIVGIAGDARHGGLRRAPQPMVFHPLAQHPQARPFVLHVRAPGHPASLASPVREAVRSTDRRLLVPSLRTMDEQMTAELRQERLFAALSALFAGFGLCLSCVGLYGVTADSVERRTREIGIRVALGARRRRVVALVLRETLATVAVGLAAGGLAAVACAPLVKGILFGVAATSPVTIVAAAAALALAATAAAGIPAWRASRIDPAAALRRE
jgi:predicted permease